MKTLLIVFSALFFLSTCTANPVYELLAPLDDGVHYPVLNQSEKGKEKEKQRSD